MPRRNEWTGYAKGQGYDAASPAQMDLIERLTRQKRVGTHRSHGIKRILGKNPIGGLKKRRASEVIDGLMAL